MKISRTVVLAFIASSVLACSAFAETKGEKKDRKPASDCTVSTNKTKILITGECAEELKDAMASKNLNRGGTLVCQMSGCSIDVEAGDQGAGGR